MTGGDVAIVGMACLFPGAPDLDTYWQNIVSKVDAVTDPPPEAWDADLFYDPDATANDRVYCKRGGFLGPLAQFNPLEHGIMPLGIDGSEPDQWLALRVARAALADAGYADEVPDRERAAVILGKGTYLNRGNFNVVQHGTVVDQTLEILKTLHPEYTTADLEQIREELKRGLPPFNADTVPGLIPNIIAGRIANRLDLMGPSYTVDAACASSLVAVDIAVRGLGHKDYDLALVGGSQVVTPVPVLMVFCHLGAVSRQQQIRPFDTGADGTILGEGVGMMVLKRLEDAEREGDRIYAVIKGVGVASDGRGLSVTAPRLEGEVLALQRAYEKAGISPRTVGLVEAHGTGTPVGDATEIEALTRVFGHRGDALPWCGLGSIKSMIGHLMPAAGIAGLIKAALALHHKVLPPTLHVEKPNSQLQEERTPFYVNVDSRPWIHASSDTPRRAGVNAFGFGGINAHVILEDHPVPEGSALLRNPLRWDSEVCILSAASRPELVDRARRLQQLLDTWPKIELKDLAYTLNVPLEEGAVRLAIVATDIEDLQGKLARALERLSDAKRGKIQDVQGIYFFAQPLAASGQLAFLFPGEGSQYVNMLADLCIHFPQVREQFDLVDRVFAQHGREPKPSDTIFPRPAFSEAERSAVETRLWQIDGAVEAVLTANRALFALLGCLDIQPEAVVGHSTGAYSAMLASGMVDLTDESRLGSFAQELNGIYRRLVAREEIPRTPLVAIGADADTVSAIIRQVDGEVYVAMDNCPHQTVIAGEEQTVARVVELLSAKGVMHERLPFDRPYHTPLFEVFAAELREFFARWLTSAPQIETYSCTSVAPLPVAVPEIQEIALDHWLRPVQFRKTIEAMYADGVHIFVEVGPKGNLCAFVDDCLRGRPHLAVPVNVMHRSGITQLNHLVGLLAAQGVSLQLEPLYARRSPRRLDLDRPGSLDKDEKGAKGSIKLLTGWPSMTLSQEAADRLRSRAPEVLPGAPARDASADKPASTVTSASSGNTEAGKTGIEAPSAPNSASPVPAGTTDRAVSATAQAMSAHFQTMEQFLSVQQDVMQAFLAGRRPASIPPSVSEGETGADRDRLGQPPEQAAPSPPSAQPTGTADVPDEPSPLPEVEDAAPVSPETLTPQGISDVLLLLVSERTGYPVEMLDLDLDLEAELGIDSIKRVEILGSFQRQTGLTTAEDMEQLAGRRTLREVIRFFSAQGSGSTDREPAPLPPSAQGGSAQDLESIPPLPFIGQVLSLTAGEELVAHCEISLQDASFLKDHALGRQISTTDPGLRGLPLMPLTVSMEMLAEAASVLASGQRLIGMREVRAHRWIALEGDALTLELRARRDPMASGLHIVAQILEVGDSVPIVEGTMVFNDTYPDAPLSGQFPLQDERPSRWAPQQLYRDVMFHGPAFQGVASMDRWGSDGAEATLRVLEPDGLFLSQPNPSFITDPVLLDQPGQVVGFWTSDHLPTGYVVFPFRLEALHLYGPNLEPPERARCRARISLIGEEQVRSDLDVIGRDDRVRVRFEGWWDRRFDLPDAIFRALLAPQEAVFGKPWKNLAGSWPASEGLQAYRLGLEDFPEGFFSAHGAIWQRALAHLVLSRKERELWRGLRTPPRRRLEWLLGRMAAKDAVRRYLKDRHDLALCPADVEVLPDSAGRPVAHGAWTERLSFALLLSISHAAGTAMAVMGDGEGMSGVGVDLEPLDRMTDEVERLAFTPRERALLSGMPEGEKDDSWSVRFWCAKEAVAKAAGQGMVDGPQGLEVQELDMHDGLVKVKLGPELGGRMPDNDGSALTAFTFRDGEMIVAISAPMKTKDDKAR